MFRRLVLALAIVMLGGLSAGTASAQSSPTSVTLGWTAPGDDSLSGTAAQYDLRFAASPITGGNFSSATRVNGVPSPLVSGSAQSHLVTGLTPNTTYWFAIRTADEGGNWSGVSNVVSFTTPVSSDSIRPAPPAVSLGATTDNSVTLNWNAVGDDSLAGTADRYEVRWSASPITEANFAGAVLVLSGVPTPGAPGTPQSVTIGGLDRSVDLYFALRAADAVNHWSAISNVVRANHLLDTAPPATPSGLSAALEAGGVHVRWNANGEPDLAGYHVYRAIAAGGAFTRIDPSTVATNDFVDAAAPDSASLWYAVSALDQANNESARSAAFRVWLHAGNISAWKLQPAYPNPSGISDPVTLPVEIPVAGPFDGRLDILDSAGQRVRTIELRNLSPGTGSLIWDGRNDAGRSTAPGVYRAWLQVGGTKSLVKLVRKP